MFNSIQQIITSVKRASSITLTADGATAHTGESYVAVTGHWIDRVQQTGQTLQLGKCSWKLLSAVLAVSVDNGICICKVYLHACMHDICIHRLF